MNRVRAARHPVRAARDPTELTGLSSPFLAPQTRNHAPRANCQNASIYLFFFIFFFFFTLLVPA
jgi:hypothetical protein